MTPRDAIIAELHRLSVVDETGKRYVRQADAARAIGVSVAAVKYWQARGLVHPLRLPVPPKVGRRGGQRLGRGAALNGVMTCLPLDELVQRVRVLRRAHQWSDADRDLILAKLGRVGYAALARQIGCSVEAVRKQAIALGVGIKSAQGLWTTWQIADHLGVPRDTVCDWCSARGLPHRRTDSGRASVYLIDPARLLAWLRERPRIARRITPVAWRRLEHLTTDVVVNGGPLQSKEAA